MGSHLDIPFDNLKGRGFIEGLGESVQPAPDLLVTGVGGMPAGPLTQIWRNNGSNGEESVSTGRTEAGGGR